MVAYECEMRSRQEIIFHSIWKLHRTVYGERLIWCVFPPLAPCLRLSVNERVCVLTAEQWIKLIPNVASLWPGVWARKYMAMTLSTCTYVPFSASPAPNERRRESSGNDAPFILCECNKRRLEGDGINEKKEKIDLLKITHIRTRVRGEARRGGVDKRDIGKNSESWSVDENDEEIYGMMALKIIRCTIRLFFSFWGRTRVCSIFGCSPSFFHFSHDAACGMPLYRLQSHCFVRI